MYAIRGTKGTIIKFKPNVAQRAFYNSSWYFNHILKARQMGFSTFINIQNLDALLFAPPGGIVCGVIDNRIDDAHGKIAMVALAYERMDDPEIHPDTWKLGKLVKSAVTLVVKNKEELVFSNGSRIYCGTSLRGGTVQRLHISELGKTSYFSPVKAEEIKTGAFNTVHAGCVMNIESTHEGGKWGMHYKMLQQAIGRIGKKHAQTDTKFHFFPWYKEPTYSLNDNIPLRPEMVRYFDELREKGITLTQGQMLWYDRKEEQQGFGMRKEFPTTPGEAFDAIVEGAIYGVEIADARAQGRVIDFEPVPGARFFTFWDIGGADYTAIWLIMAVGHKFYFLDWHENNRAHADHYYNVCREWERKYGMVLRNNFLPHDGSSTGKLAGSAQDELIKAGLEDIIIVPRTSDVWLGINHFRRLIPSCVFHTRTNIPRMKDGEEHPSGLACLEAYHTGGISSNGTIREAPVHDESSHTADAARTFAEAHKLGLIPAGGSEFTNRRIINRIRR